MRRGASPRSGDISITINIESCAVRWWLCFLDPFFSFNFGPNSHSFRVQWRMRLLFVLRRVRRGRKRKKKYYKGRKSVGRQLSVSNAGKFNFLDAFFGPCVHARPWEIITIMVMQGEKAVVGEDRQHGMGSWIPA